jgi:TetR/AcrR family transcriptional repressor of nem operon
MQKYEERPHTYQDTRERILATGEQLILGRGFSALGLSEILAAAAVRKARSIIIFNRKKVLALRCWNATSPTISSG